MFSVVVPLWNKRHTVAATLASALAQSWRDFELIIVDDGSTDGGMEEAARFDDPRIRRLRQVNQGPGPARNAAIRAARHDWYAFLDADDLWLPDHLEELDRIRRRFPEAGLIGTKILRSDRNGRYRLPARPQDRIERVDFFECAARGAWPATTSSLAVPRRTWASLGGFSDAPRGQDVEYWTRIALDFPVAVSRRATAVYVAGTGGICDTVQSPCLTRELRHWGDICPSMGVLYERRTEPRSAELARTIDLLIDRQFHYSTRQAARVGDIGTLRALSRLYLRRPPLNDRLLLALARGPAPVARASFAIGLKLKALMRALRPKRGLQSQAPRRTVRQYSGGTASSRLPAAVAPARSELV
jgi:glycosyltransferase involved in cell wall biosynthesis